MSNGRKFHDTAQICENGHLITMNFDTEPHNRKSFCTICSAKTITECPNCKKTIQGCLVHEYEVFDFCNSYNEDIFGNSQGNQSHYETEYCTTELDLPSYCHGCGAPYPWTESLIGSFNEIIDLAEELDVPEKTILKESFPKLINDQPESSVAAIKISKILKNAAEITVSGLRSAISEKVTSELFKSLMGW